MRHDIPLKDWLHAQDDFLFFWQMMGLQPSELLKGLVRAVDPTALERENSCVAISTPPQEGKTTFISHYIAWQLIRNPWLHIIYVSYSQFRANTVSRQIRQIVEQWTPLKPGSTSVSNWETKQGGGLLAAGRGTGVTGFSCDLLVVDDPVKDMQEAQSETIRQLIKDHYDSVLMTRMANLSQIVIIATRWHKDDLIGHVIKQYNAQYVNIPAQAVSDTDWLQRPVGSWLKSVQGRSVEMWERLKSSVGSYVWEALYQGDPVTPGGSYINVDMIDVVPWDSVVYKDRNGFLVTLDNALVVQSWDLAFTGKGDYVAGQVWANIRGTWVMIDRVHERATFTRSISLVQQLAARWVQTSAIYVEQAANGAALIDTLKRRANLIVPVIPRGSKETRALAIQPLIEAGRVKIVDAVYSDDLFQEWRDFPYTKHDDQVDAMTQALTQARQSFIRIGD